MNSLHEENSDSISSIISLLSFIFKKLISMSANSTDTATSASRFEDMLFSVYLRAFYKPDLNRNKFID